jgi:hypothetical protein
MNIEGHANVPNIFINVQSQPNQAMMHKSDFNKKKDAVLYASQYFAKQYRSSVYGDFNDPEIFHTV